MDFDARVKSKEDMVRAVLDDMLQAQGVRATPAEKERLVVATMLAAQAALQALGDLSLKEDLH